MVADWDVILSYCSRAMKRCLEQGNLQEEAFNWGLFTVSEGESTIIMVGSMLAGRQAWHCSSS